MTLVTLALLLTGCMKERCPDSADDDTGAPSCSEDFTAQPGEECDAETDTPCMDGSIFMSCNEGLWNGVVHHPGDPDSCE